MTQLGVLMASAPQAHGMLKAGQYYFSVPKALPGFIPSAVPMSSSAFYST